LVSSSFSDFGEVLEHKRIIVCVGSGGVGKTTTAAALALESARRGQRTLVLTIDPARRLANSLGLNELGHEIQQVPDELIAAAGPREDDSGHLYAMMLDQKRAFDEMVERHASDPAAVNRILENPVYAQISGSLAGSQEYAAMAKVHEFDREKNFDLIVVDTPPTAHALDFLDAPQKLTNAIDSPAIEWFRAMRGQKKGRSLLGRTGAYVMKRLAKFVGSQFLEDLAVFFTEFNDILGGFQQRAIETFALFRQEKVGFVLVASPEAMAVREALFFHQRLTTSAMPFAGFVVNRVHDNLPMEGNAQSIQAALASVPEVQELGLSGSSLKMASEALVASHEDLQAIAKADLEAIDRLREAGGESALLVQVPLFKEDIHHIERLAALGRYIVQS
jgi:anion-transporting  ArsA/GET3 family ATPase